MELGCRQGGGWLAVIALDCYTALALAGSLAWLACSDLPCHWLSFLTSPGRLPGSPALSPKLSFASIGGYWLALFWGDLWDSANESGHPLTPPQEHKGPAQCGLLEDLCDVSRRNQMNE